MTDMTEGEYVYHPTMYIVELEREDIMSLVHAAHMHAEKLPAPESKKLIDSANRLSDQAVYYANGCS
jgi:hypothetical protein